MNLSKNGKWGAIAVVVVALVAGGAAYAATKLHTSSASAAQSGGRFGGGPVAGGGYGFRPGGGAGRGRGFGGPGGGSISAAATYLGLSTSDLFTQLRNGKTLAQIANATSGKSASGLIDAMVAAEKTQVEQSVTSGRLTRSQADQLESDLKTRVTALVNGTGFGGGRGGFGGPPGGDDGGGFGGPPGGSGGTSTTPTQHI